MMKFRVSEGREIPAAGLGMWKVETTDAASLVVDAVDAGWRHFDCACDYGNEEEVGQGLRQVMEEKRAARDDLWVTSKLWNTYHQADHVRPAPAFRGAGPAQDHGRTWAGPVARRPGSPAHPARPG
ncbi:MAG: aldo/keto reductase [Verrucomicrobiota bacterium]